MCRCVCVCVCVVCVCVVCVGVCGVCVCVVCVCVVCVVCVCVCLIKRPPFAFYTLQASMLPHLPTAPYNSLIRSTRTLASCFFYTLTSTYFIPYVFT